MGQHWHCKELNDPLKINSKMKTGQGEFQETSSNTEEAAEVEVLTEVVNTWFGVYLIYEYEIFLQAAKIEWSMLGL